MTSKPPPIEILLATFEGSRFLEAQLDSLVAQTHRHWVLLARDDGSSDATRSILDGFASRHRDRIRVLPPDGRRLGAAGNFAALIEASTAPYVMFCDQDDVWLPDKIEITLDAMTALEGRRGGPAPLLVHTDLRVVDEELQAIADSMWAFQQTDPRRQAVLSRALLQNFVTGCTMMANRALLDLARPVPREARMHDWWLMLTALCFGAVESVPRATMLYRQHGRNARGATRFSALRDAVAILGRARWRQASDRRWGEIRRQEAQAAAFLARFHDRLPEDARETLASFASLSSQGFFSRRASIVRHRFYYSNPVMTAAMLLLR